MSISSASLETISRIASQSALVKSISGVKDSLRRDRAYPSHCAAIFRDSKVSRSFA